MRATKFYKALDFPTPIEGYKNPNAKKQRHLDQYVVSQIDGNKVSSVDRWSVRQITKKFFD